MTSMLPVEEALLVILLLIAVVATGAFLRAVTVGGRVGVETHWGGLDGSSSGWHASNPLVALLLAVAGWLLFSGVGLQVASSERAAAEKNANPAASASAAPAKSP